ncbi:MAG: hypothetical protein SOW36_07240 [Porphyromonas sp.]|uniref:hypothetical protein n=1 Tax=Porphyromonas sp. TaxID=1924944 RepID=UPI002A747EB0|nr:hypothetical protein [Porphyromonas sp.]MDD6927761.1 hypothetical protein [Bacteroidales bacterium]MDY3112413.1 hypothetical protein [Porphyromonas sp.]
MKKLASFLLLTVLVLSCRTTEPTSDPSAENREKVEFTATPASFSLRGGKGVVEGVIRETTPEGKVVKETPIAKEDFTLRLKSGDATQLSLDERAKIYTVAEGISATFEIEAEVTRGTQKGFKQTLTVIRGGEITYTFVATPTLFTAEGGVGHVIGKQKITDISGATLEERLLENSEFTLTLKKGEAIDISVDDVAKSFTVHEGNTALFELEAIAKGSDTPQEIKVSREGSITYTFEAHPNNFTSEGGEGEIRGRYVLKDILGNSLATKALPNEAYNLSLKSGDASQVTLDNAKKRFTIKSGEKEETFVFEAKPFTTGSVALEITIHRDAVKVPKVVLPLEYLTEFNINPAGTGFVTSHAKDASGYFSWNDAVAKFSSIVIDGKNYHLPSKQEWLAIIPSYAEDNGSDYIVWEESGSRKNVVENVIVSGKNISSKNDYLSDGNYCTYALRFKDTNLVSAWKYEYLKNPSGGYWMKISCKKVEPKVTIEEISKSAFWDNAKDVIVRYLPACGYYAKGVANEVGNFGNYWTCTPHSEGYAYGVYFYYGGAGTGNYQDFVTSQFTIRLFRG